MPTRSRWLALALLATTQFVLVLDAAIVNVALPSMGRDLGVDQDTLSWVANGYALTFGGFLLFGGRVADLAGRRRMFVGGLAGFAAASLVGGLAPTMSVLIAARAVQGIGAALVAPAALSLVMVLFADGAERNRAMAVWGAVSAAGGATGSILGGLLTEWLGWRSVLWVNVPIAALAIALAPLLLLRAEGTGGRGFDLTGAVSVTGGLAVLVYAFVGAGEVGWSSTRTLGLIALAVVLLAVFALIERRTARPLVPLSVFRRRTLTGANVLALLLAMGMMPTFFFIALYLQRVRGYDPIGAGLGLVPIAVALATGAQIVPRLVARLGFRVPLVLGFVLNAVGLVWFSRINATGGFAAEILGPSLVTGLGASFLFVSVTIAGTSGVPRHEAGLASGLINTTQQMGGALGLAVLVAVATARTEAAANSGPVALTDGYRAGLLGGAIFAATGAVLATALFARQGRPAAPDDTPAADPAVASR